MWGGAGDTTEIRWDAGAHPLHTATSPEVDDSHALLTHCWLEHCMFVMQGAPPCRSGLHVIVAVSQNEVVAQLPCMKKPVLPVHVTPFATRGAHFWSAPQ